MRFFTHLLSCIALTLLALLSTRHVVYGQNNSLVHSNFYSSPNVGYGDLEFLEEDSVFVYQFYGTNYDLYPVNYGLWTDTFAPNTYETEGHKTVFLDMDWNALGFFESGTQVLNTSPIDWYLFNGGTGYANIRRPSSDPYFQGLPYDILGGFSELYYDKMIYEFNPDEDWVLPLIFSNYESNLYDQMPSSFYRSLSPDWYNNKYSVSLNDTESVFVFSLMGEQIINETYQTSTSPSNLGYNWIKYNHASGNFELTTVSSENDLISYSAIFPSRDDNVYYGVKSLRGEAPAFDTSSLPYDNLMSDSTYTNVLMRENEMGEALWTAELYAYNNFYSDSSSGTSVSAGVIGGSLVEVNDRAFYSENTLLDVYANDTLYLKDFLGQDTVYVHGPLSLSCAISDITYSKSFLFSLDAYSGEKHGMLEIDGFQFMRYGGAGQDCDPSEAHYQVPQVFAVGDSLAWVHDFYALNDTTVTFISTLMDGVPNEFELNLQAGYSSVILWVNTDLAILDAWVIPATLGGEDYSLGIQISEVVALGQDSILIAATIDPLVTTNMDPSGQADLVSYDLVRTSFLGVYGIQTVDGLFDRPERTLIFSVFPNPSSDILNIRLGQDVYDATYSLLDISGRVLKSGILTGSDSYFSISVSDIQSGTYFLRISSDNLSGVKKVIVK